MEFRKPSFPHHRSRGSHASAGGAGLPGSVRRWWQLVWDRHHNVWNSSGPSDGQSSAGILRVRLRERDVDNRCNAFRCVGVSIIFYNPNKTSLYKWRYFNWVVDLPVGRRYSSWCRVFFQKLNQMAPLTDADLLCCSFLSAELLPGATCWHDPRDRAASQKVPAPWRRSLHPRKHLQRLQTKSKRAV